MYVQYLEITRCAVVDAYYVSRVGANNTEVEITKVLRTSEDTAGDQRIKDLVCKWNKCKKKWKSRKVES